MSGRGVRPSSAELRAALREVVGILASASPGDAGSAWYALGAAQASALIALGVPSGEWAAAIEDMKASREARQKEAGKP